LWHSLPAKAPTSRGSVQLLYSLWQGVKVSARQRCGAAKATDTQPASSGWQGLTDYSWLPPRQCLPKWRSQHSPPLALRARSDLLPIIARANGVDLPNFSMARTRPAPGSSTVWYQPLSLHCAGKMKQSAARAIGLQAFNRYYGPINQP
jgi:hypothetical protein